MTRISAVWLMIAALVACSPTETIVVRGPITVPAPTDSSRNVADPVVAVRIAETGRMETWDPILARTHANRRVLSLVLEGLVGLDPAGRPVPALAWDWQVAPDSLSWTFRIREESRFHPDAAMGSGSGRRATSADVYAAFARMADRNLPHTGADLFAGVILGFDLFNREQREVYLPHARNTTRIIGIETPDERTVVFRLVRKDPEFLQKLASPAAWIAAPESAGLEGRTIGTGMWRWRATEGDSSVTLVRHAAHPDGAKTPFSRVDIRFLSSETAVYRALVRNEADLVPEAGPRIRQNLQVPGTTTPGFRIVPLASTDAVSFRWNPNGAKGLREADARAWLLHAMDADLRARLTTAGYRTEPHPPADAAWTGGSSPTLNLKLGIEPDEDYVGRLIFDRMRDTAAARLVTGPVVSRDVDVYTLLQTPFLTPADAADGVELIRFEVDRIGLTGTRLTGFAGSAYPWSVDLRNLTPVP